MDVINPKDSIEIILKKVNKNDVICIPDHFNLPGIPDYLTIKKILSTNKTELDHIILDNPNKLFYFFSHPQFVDHQPNNCVFLPLYYICQMWQHKQYKGQNYEFDSNIKKYSVCTVGGRNRWHRVLLSFWCGSYLDKNNFCYTMMENMDLTQIQYLISNSKTNIKLDKKKFLPKKYVDDLELPLRYGAVDDISYQDPLTTFEYFIPNITGQSYINLITEAQSLELHGGLTEMSLRPFLSYNFPLWLGSYKHHKLFRKLGFDVFGDVIKHNHLNQLDRVQSVIQGLEDNKHLFYDIKNCHEQYMINKSRLIHNKQLALDYNHFFDFFRKEMTSFFKYFSKSNLTWVDVDLHPDFLQLCIEKYIDKNK